MIQDRPPDSLGGPLAEGDKAIKSGKFLLNPDAWNGVRFSYSDGQSKFLQYFMKFICLQYLGYVGPLIVVC